MFSLWVILASFLICKCLEWITHDSYRPQLTVKEATSVIGVLCVNFLFLYVLSNPMTQFFYWHSIYNLDNYTLNPLAEVMLYFAFNALILYGSHRLMHRNKWLWAIHKVHHSIKEVSLLRGFFSHPFEPLVNALFIAVFDFGILGLNPTSVGRSSAIIAFLNIFVHSNIKTPRWLGYVIQRPEMHKIHHSFAHHRDNFTFLSIWDIVFKTFNNQTKTLTYRFGFK